MSKSGVLWRNADFLKLWGGETVSLFGSQVTTMALPLTAALTMQATAEQVGILQTARFAPYLILTLFAGVWVDQNQRRPLLIITNFGRALLVGLIPLLAYLSLLQIPHLYIIAFLIGTLSVLFDLAYQSYLPSVIQREELVEGNSKLQASASAAEVGGPGLAGILVEIFSAPMALVVDALSFVVGGVSLMLIRKPEPEPAAKKGRQNVWRLIGEGLGIVFRNPFLRAIAGEASTYNLFNTMISTIFVLFAIRELGMSPKWYGIIIGVGSGGSLVGAMMARGAARRLGVGRTILSAMLLSCVTMLAIPLVSGKGALAVTVLIASFFLNGIGVTVSNVHVISLRQIVTPDHLLGRMSAGYRFFVIGTVPLGAYLGGLLGDLIGLRGALAVSAIGLTTAVLWVMFSPIRMLKEMPTSSPAAMLEEQGVSNA